MKREREFTYKYFLTTEEFKNNRGYDLEARLTQGDFPSKTLAADNFCQDALDEIKQMVCQWRGAYWFNNFIDDSSNYRDAEISTGFNEIFIDMYNLFSEALELWILYRFEVGNSIDMDKTQEINPYHEDAIKKLVSGGFIPQGA